MRYILAVTALLLGFASQAEAANCVSPLTGNDATGTSRNFGVTIDASNNCYGNVSLVDGTNAANKVAVKAASTAAGATDPALVVAISPNNSVAVTGTVTANAGTNLNTSALGTAANQATIIGVLGTVTTAHGCSAAGYTAIGCLGQIDDDIKAPVPANSFVGLIDSGGTNKGAINSAGQLGVILNAETTKVIGEVNQGTSPWVVSNGGTFAVQASLNTAPSLANGNGVVPTQGGSVLSATNGGYQNLLQGNAVLSASNPIFITPVPTAGDGCSPYHLAGGTTASTNSNSIKASAAGTLCKIAPISTSATLAYLKIYDSAGAPTCSSATGLKHVYPIVASATGAGEVVPDPMGEAYANGIGFCVTGGGADTDSSNAPTGVYIEASFK